jgi:hypothetical protein
LDAIGDSSLSPARCSRGMKGDSWTLTSHDARSAPASWSLKVAVRSALQRLTAERSATFGCGRKAALGGNEAKKLAAYLMFWLPCSLSRSRIAAVQETGVQTAATSLPMPHANQVPNSRVIWGPTVRARRAAGLIVLAVQALDRALSRCLKAPLGLY